MPNRPRVVPVDRPAAAAPSVEADVPSFDEQVDEAMERHPSAQSVESVRPDWPQLLTTVAALEDAAEADPTPARQSVHAKVYADIFVMLLAQNGTEDQALEFAIDQANLTAAIAADHYQPYQPEAE